MVGGECLCGAIRYEIRGAITGIWLCHCSKCRRSSGSAFLPGAICKRGDFRWLRGEDHVSEYRQASGYRRRFCRDCASPVPLFPEDTPYVWLPVGALEGELELRPTHHIFVGSKASWFDIHDDLPQFTEHAGHAR